MSQDIPRPRSVADADAAAAAAETPKHDPETVAIGYRIIAGVVLLVAGSFVLGQGMGLTKAKKAKEMAA